MKIRDRKDFYSGIIFIFFGISAVLLARSDPMGTALRMGPGYFLTLLGTTLALLGFVVTARCLWLSGEVIKPCALRPLVLVLGSVLALPSAHRQRQMYRP